jgi:peptide subunit release factor 1 (eRF1)
VAAFARAIAGEVGRALEDAGVDLLIIAGDEIITTALSETLDRAVQERIVAQIRLDATASPHQVIAATLPLVAQVEREREAAAVDRLRENLGGGLAVAGAVDVANALLANQVGLLIMNDDFHEAGWADYAHSTVGVGAKPAQSPYGGDTGALVEVGLDEEFVRIALATGAEIEIVHSTTPVAPDDGSRVSAGQRTPKSEAAARLDEVGGVGAILRYASR